MFQLTSSPLKKQVCLVLQNTDHAVYLLVRFLRQHEDAPWDMDGVWKQTLPVLLLILSVLPSCRVEAEGIWRNTLRLHFLGAQNFWNAIPELTSEVFLAGVFLSATGLADLISSSDAIFPHHKPKTPHAANISLPTKFHPQSEARAPERKILTLHIAADATLAVPNPVPEGLQHGRFAKVAALDFSLRIPVQGYRCRNRKTKVWSLSPSIRPEALTDSTCSIPLSSILRLISLNVHFSTSTPFNFPVKGPKNLKPLHPKS